MRKSSVTNDTKAKTKPAMGQIAIQSDFRAFICLRSSNIPKILQALIDEIKRISAKSVVSPLLIMIPSKMPILKARKPQRDPCQLIRSRVPSAGTKPEKARFVQ